MNPQPTMLPFLPARLFLAMLVVVAGIMLVLKWFDGRGPWDPISMSVVFSGALIARCLLAIASELRAVAASRGAAGAPRD